MVKEKKEVKAKYPLPVPYELKSTEEREFLPRIVPIDLIIEDDFEKAFEGIGFKKDKRVIPSTLKNHVKGQIPSEIQYQKGGMFAVYESPTEPSELDFPRNTEQYITPNGITEEGKKIIDQNVSNIRVEINEKLKRARKDRQIVQKLVDVGSHIPKGVKSSDCYTEIKVNDVPVFVFNNVKPPVRNLYNKSVYCPNGITYGFLKKVGKKGISKKHIGGTTFTSDVDNGKTILDHAKNQVEREELRLEGLEKVFNNPDTITTQNNNLINHVKKLYGDTIQYAYIEDCDTHKNELYPLEALPNDIEYRRNYMDMMLAKKGGDVCRGSDVFLFRDGKWGEVGSGMLGYHSKYITDPKTLDKLNNAKKMSTPKKK